MDGMRADRKNLGAGIRKMRSVAKQLMAWAEALHLWENGEKLYLEDELLGEAEIIQRSALEEDDRQGLVEAYLETLLPLRWPDMDLYARRGYFSGPDDPTREKGTVRWETVSNVEIWAECLMKDPALMKRQDSYEICAMMEKIDGWKRSAKREYLPLYGRQRLYVREERVPDLPDRGTAGTAFPASSGDCGTAGTGVQETVYDFLL